MDIKVNRRPFPLGGVQWSTANRWIIGTSGRVFILTPECVMAGDMREKREVSAIIEAANSVEAVCLLEPLPRQYIYDNALGVLSSDSSLRIFAPLGNPDAENWSQVGSYKSEAGAGQMCAISCISASVAVAACGFMNGKVELIRLESLEEDTGNIGTTMVLGVDASQNTICHIAWINSRDPHNLLLLVCAVDGSAGLWRIASDLSQAILLTTIGGQDWRAYTAHCVNGGCLVLAKTGSVAIVDILAEGVPKIQYATLAVSQTVVSCVIDESRGRIYVGTTDFIIFVLSKQHDKWSRMPEEERELRDGMRQTVVKSFTTKFKMSSVMLRSLALSPNARYLAFAADDQVNWDTSIDGIGITRMHFHQFDDWTSESVERSLIKLVDGDYQGELRYAIWDLLDWCSAEDVTKMVEYLRQINVASGSDQESQQLAMLNFIASTLKGAQLGVLATEARNAALDLHVKKLFAYLGSKANSGKLVMSDADRAYLAQVNWAVHQPAYAGVVDKLPNIGSSTEKPQPLDCPACGKDMVLVSRQTACCANKHTLEMCSVTLEILGSPGSDQCNTCKAKRMRGGSQHASFIDLAKAQFPRCPFCNDRFFPTAG
ncbi:hypothetical protein GGH93_005513 [Coemansia aciculifera]|nr:hypothetical protein GGH93_005513 [Coemansia aciculifera]